MKAPGIRMRPLPELTDREHVDFNEVFFDGVVVPRDHLVGPLNQGWSISAGSLAHERGMMWLSSAAQLDGTLERLFELARERGPDGRRIGESADASATQLAGLYVDAQAMWFMGYRGFAKFARGQVSPEHSVLKLFGSEIAQRAARLATEAQGVDALDVDFHGWGYDESFGAAPWMKRYLQTYGAHDLGGRLRDPAQHHRAARARPARGADERDIAEDRAMKMERHDPGERRRPRLRAARHVGAARRPRSGRTARRGSSTRRTAATSGCSRASRSPTSG